MATSEEPIASAPHAAAVTETVPPTPSKRVWLPFHFALAALVVVAVFLFSGGSSMRDPDIWWHLNNAQQIVQTGHMPRVDVYSFTARGSAWMDHEWLAEIPYYFAYRAFGLRGLQAMWLSLAFIIQVGILYRCYKLTGDVKNTFVIVVFDVMLVLVSYGPRMLLFGWIYMLILLFALDRFREGKEKWAWVIPPLFLLWINTHGSWMIGLTVFGIVAFSGLLQFDIGLVGSTRWSRSQMKTLAIVFAISLAALLVNPYGYKLVTYPFDLAYQQKLNVEHVEEWASVDFHNARGKVIFIMLGGLLAAPLFSRRKWQLDEVLLVALAVYSGLTYVRFVFLMAILITPVLAARLKLFPPYNAAIDKSWLNLAVVLIIAGIVVHRFPTNSALQASIDDNFPTHSITYLREHKITDRVLAHYMWGGYLERYYPEMPVFIDSRVDIFEYNGTLKDYLDIIGMKEPLALLDKHKIEYVYFTPSDPLVYLLRNTGKWDVLNEDKVSILLKRRDPVPATH